MSEDNKEVMSENLDDDAVQEQTPEQKARAESAVRSAEKKQNLHRVFGSGLGKLAICAAGVVVVIFLAIGVRTLTAKPKDIEKEDKSVVDAPNVDTRGANGTDGLISPTEAARRDEAAQREAEKAQQEGASYQPPLTGNALAEASTNVPAAGAATFNINVPPTPGTTTTAPDPTREAQSAEDDPKATAAAAAQQQEQQRLDSEFKQASTERDKYVENIKSRVLSQVETLTGVGGQGGALNNYGSYSVVSYPKAKSTDVSAGQASASVSGGSSGAVAATPKLLFKTGSTIFATLDSEINTDDGSDVFATVRGGPWDGSKLLGKVEQTPNNIRARFTVLAPQDGRDTVVIDALAMRTADAKTGIASRIDAHTVSRYSSLGFASLLSGYGKAFEQTPGTTITTPGGTTTQTVEEPTSSIIVGRTVGELGKNIGEEVKRGFQRPTTYSTPAETGFAVFFMSDAFATAK